ncbi:hypothetical protein E3N88_23958 [Mikania micrantha]|uniref:Uncharacterized protein n=1 Tax=Mikania micrantha TaxID=192012 RepID=A0A5N6NGT9_9ASTR|nr:hypothetical protein E3N88_23958 [Mikania micrantha]
MTGQALLRLARPAWLGILHHLSDVGISDKPGWGKAFLGKGKQGGLMRRCFMKVTEVSLDKAKHSGCHSYELSSLTIQQEYWVYNIYVIMATQGQHLPGPLPRPNLCDEFSFSRDTIRQSFCHYLIQQVPG